MIGDDALAGLIRELAEGFAGPVVLDPVLAAGGGRDLASGALEKAIADLLPATRLATPNRAEARRLTGRAPADEAARAMLDAGCGAVLLTGADEADGEEVVNRLFEPGKPPRDYHWRRLSGVYHGSGCTLASACAAGLARGLRVADAVEAAQSFAWTALARGHAPGRGQRLPRRIAP
jgi:hydroxymethylpyrimidine/phosphomethylpyrimidine kinase